jgi:hypothetical protein
MKRDYARASTFKMTLKVQRLACHNDVSHGATGGGFTRTWLPQVSSRPATAAHQTLA